MYVRAFVGLCLQVRRVYSLARDETHHKASWDYAALRFDIREVTARGQIGAIVVSIVVNAVELVGDMLTEQADGAAHGRHPTVGSTLQAHGGVGGVWRGEERLVRCNELGGWLFILKRSLE